MNKPRNQKTTKLLTYLGVHLAWEDAKTGIKEGGNLACPITVPVGNGGPAGTVLFRCVLGGDFEVTISTTKRKCARKVNK
jgi:hypothetical protein